MLVEPTIRLRSQETLDNFIPDANASNQIFFLSDGNPNEGEGSNGEALSDTIRPLWDAFVNDPAFDINVTSVGVGDNIDLGPLQEIDVDGMGAPVLAENFQTLVETLIDVVAQPVPINVRINDIDSADGTRIQSITVDGTTYEFDGVASVTPTNGAATVTGTSITVTTALGGEFTFDLADGTGVYVAPIGLTTDEAETFEYVLVDGDGDTDSAIVTIDIPIAPDVEVDILDDNLSDADNSSLVTFTFTEDVINFDNSDVSVVGGMLSTITPVPGAGPNSMFTATFTADDNFDGLGSSNGESGRLY